jgi:hypothetical protein
MIMDSKLIALSSNMPLVDHSLHSIAEAHICNRHREEPYRDCYPKNVLHGESPSIRVGTKANLRFFHQWQIGTVIMTTRVLRVLGMVTIDFEFRIGNTCTLVLRAFRPSNNSEIRNQRKNPTLTAQNSRMARGAELTNEFGTAFCILDRQQAAPFQSKRPLGNDPMVIQYQAS